jgi:hypothetical protein|tara:strand:- start:84 stop:611 length:528 start_codon:yes stop_codon:yes gene_type:complete
MANITDFKAKLAGGGARANQFKVTMPFPGYAQVGGEIEELAFLCTGASIPAMTVGTVPVSFRGRVIKLAGDRTFADFTITVLNDTNFKLRNAFERWQNGINNMTDNEGLTNPADYQVDAFLDHLDRNGNTIKSYTIRGAFPTTVSDIPLDYNEKTEVETFTVTLSYQYFESNTTT